MTNQTQNSKPQKWFHNKTTIILLLIFLYPIGLIGLFLRKETKIWKKILASIPIFFFLLLILVPATNNYELAIDEINKENYLVAYNYLSIVDKSDENYENSQIKLQEIDSLAQKEANNIFSKISENYNQIKQMINAEKFEDAKKLATKTIKLYDNLKFIYPEAKQDSVYIDLVEIKKYKQNEIENEVVELTEFQKDSIAKIEQIKQDSIDKVEKEKIYELRKSQTITAVDLYAAYQANEVSADNNYKGKNFYVEGYIDDIAKDILNDIYVTLKTGEMFMSVQCYIKDADKVAELQKGQKITVYGKCDGFVLLSVLMKNCEITENLSDLE